MKEIGYFVEMNRKTVRALNKLRQNFDIKNMTIRHMGDKFYNLEMIVKEQDIAGIEKIIEKII